MLVGASRTRARLSRSMKLPPLEYACPTTLSEAVALLASRDGDAKAIAVVGKAGARTIAAADFFLGPLSTALAPDEIIVEVSLPAWPAGRRFGFQEFARRRGDFAMAAAAVFYDPDKSGKATNAHAGVI